MAPVNSKEFHGLEISLHAVHAFCRNLVNYIVAELAEASADSLCDADLRCPSL